MSRFKVFLHRPSYRLPVLAVLVMAMAACATAPTGNGGGAPPQAEARVHTVILARGQQAVVADESLTVRLVEINDSRCPATVTCVWAGHAAVTLQVSKPGLAPATVVIGSQAPASRGLPYEASYAGHLFHLLALEAPGDQVPAPRATIRISRP